MTMNRTSVLAQLTAEVMAEKKTASPRKLTPVESEKAAPPPSQRALPADLPGAFMSAEAMTAAARDLRRYAADMLKIADGIDVINGVAEKVEAQSKADRERDEALALREKERLADEKASTPDFNSLQKAAQDAVFGNPLLRDGAWTCPDHGQVIDKTSSKGRKYRGCPLCNKFER